MAKNQTDNLPDKMHKILIERKNLPSVFKGEISGEEVDYVTGTITLNIIELDKYIDSHTSAAIDKAYEEVLRLSNLGEDDIMKLWKKYKNSGDQ